MEKKSIGFLYFAPNHAEEHKEEILDYLKEVSQEVNVLNQFQIIVDFHKTNLRKNPSPTEFLFLQDLEENSNKLEEICQHVLSKDRKFIPISVFCEDKTKYDMIEDILNENYGEEGKLTYGFLKLGKLFNMKYIKR